ncbi:hypothetical protein FGO68_gene13164 [Halteria grandinella]|uniref:Uncharacterized protein n=1 Tax=Halteria grandinella TaxID=5974 RepID=A0A8J8NLN6_HALGN|nr:hypothetical protein FGO68_gene13164 [Halteria grandinella]
MAEVIWRIQAFQEVKSKSLAIPILSQYYFTVCDQSMHKCSTLMLYAQQPLSQISTRALFIILSVIT